MKSGARDAAQTGHKRQATKTGRRAVCYGISNCFFFESAFVVNSTNPMWSSASGPSSQSRTRTRHAAPRARPPPRPGVKEMRRWDSKGGSVCHARGPRLRGFVAGRLTRVRGNPREGKLHGFESSNIEQRRCAEGDREAVSLARRCLQHHGEGAKRFLFSAPPPQGARYTSTSTYGRVQSCATLPGVSHFPGQPRPFEAERKKENTQPPS